MKLCLLILFSLLPSILLFAQNPIKLKGQLDKPLEEGSRIILQQYDGKGYQAADSTQIDDSVFTFHRPDGEVNLYRIKVLDKPGAFTFVWDENENVKVNLKTDSIWLSSVEGSPSSEEYLSFQKKQLPLKNQVIYYSQKASSPNLSKDSVHYYRDKQNEIVDSIFNNSLHYAKTKKPSFTTVFLLNWAQDFRKMKKEKVLPYYQLLPEEWKDHFLAKEIKRKMDSEKIYDEKAPAPEFSATHLVTQEEVNLEHLLLEKKPIVLDFWGIWCGPCIQSIPDLKQAQSDLKDKVNFISIAWDFEDKKEQTISFIEKQNMNWIHLFEDRTKNDSAYLSVKYEVENFPTLILIDKDGRLSKRAIGSIEAKQLLKELYEIPD